MLVICLKISELDTFQKLASLIRRQIKIPDDINTLEGPDLTDALENIEDQVFDLDWFNYTYFPPS